MDEASRVSACWEWLTALLLPVLLRRGSWELDELWLWWRDIVVW